MGILIMGLSGCKDKSLQEIPSEKNLSWYINREVQKQLSEPNFTENQYNSILRRLTSLETDKDLSKAYEFHTRLVAIEDIINHYKPTQSPNEVYIDTLDPNQPIYKFMLKPKEEWIKLAGENERTIIFYNLSDARVAIARLKQQNAKLEKRLRALEGVEVIDFNNMIYKDSGSVEAQ